MSEALKIALVFSIATMISAFLIGGRYTAVAGPRGNDVPLVYVVDRFTGNVGFCNGAVCRQSSPFSN